MLEPGAKKNLFTKNFFLLRKNLFADLIGRAHICGHSCPGNPGRPARPGRADHACRPGGAGPGGRARNFVTLQKNLFD